MDLELIIEKGSLARAFCEGLPPLLRSDHHLLELVDGLRERVVRHCLNVHKLSFSISLLLLLLLLLLRLLLLQLQVSIEAAMYVVNQIWQKNEFRTTDFSEALRLKSVAEVSQKGAILLQNVSLSAGSRKPVLRTAMNQP